MDRHVRRLTANFASLRLHKSLKLCLVRKHSLLSSIEKELSRRLFSPGPQVHDWYLSVSYLNQAVFLKGVPEVYLRLVKRGSSIESLHRDVSSASAVREQVGTSEALYFFFTEGDQCFLLYLYSETSSELKLVRQCHEHTY